MKPAATTNPFTSLRPRGHEALPAGIARPNLAPRRSRFEIEPRGAALRRLAMSKARI